MGFSYLTNTPLEEALSEYLKVLDENGMGPLVETVPVREALDRVTAEPVYAHICSPHYHACAMDGIALSASLTFGAGETTPVTLGPEDFIWVDTGDPLPENCDTVVMVEDVVNEGDKVVLYAPSTPWNNVRQIGEDVCAGDMLVPSFTKITPAAMGTMLAVGVLEVPVTRRPKVGIVPTGDEIIPPVSDPGEGEIIEFNSTIFSAMLSRFGAQAVVCPIVGDDPDLITSALKTALDECDAVILCAGSSAGREDYAAQAIAETGSVVCHGIAIKPGKPAILGHSGPKPVLGVPGYPVSGIIVIEQILQPVIARLTGAAPDSPETTLARLSRPIVSTLKYREYVRVCLGYVENEFIATPLNRGAGVVSSFMKADGIMEVPQDTEGFQTGEEISVRLLRLLSEIKRSLVITGSHDPLIDEMAELMRREYRDSFVSSSHVGSMGGIMALKRKAAHACGIHLLDEKTGSYNVTYVKEHFPQGGVVLVECVKRIQGLMVQKGNPKGIKTLADLQGGELKYVNRQKGSGTRILCDYLCGKDGIDKDSIYGYSNEEYTHTAVAAIVGSGSADAGLGILSAAGMYGLDFIPICEEQYDFLIAGSEFGSEKVERMLSTLKSGAFRNRLNELGGYILENPGKVRGDL